MGIYPRHPGTLFVFPFTAFEQMNSRVRAVLCKRRGWPVGSHQGTAERGVMRSHLIIFINPGQPGAQSHKIHFSQANKMCRVLSTHVGEGSRFVLPMTSQRRSSLGLDLETMQHRPQLPFFHGLLPETLSESSLKIPASRKLLPNRSIASPAS